MDQSKDGGEDKENAQHGLFPRKHPREMRNAPSGHRMRLDPRPSICTEANPVRRKDRSDRLVHRRLVEQREVIAHIAVHLRGIVLVERFHERLDLHIPARRRVGLIEGIAAVGGALVANIACLGKQVGRRLRVEVGTRR
jgi:hypothetical protein